MCPHFFGFFSFYCPSPLLFLWTSFLEREHLNLSSPQLLQAFPEASLTVLRVFFCPQPHLLSDSHSTNPPPSQIVPCNTSLTLVVAKYEIPGITLVHSLLFSLQILLISAYQWHQYFTLTISFVFIFQLNGCV